MLNLGTSGGSSARGLDRDNLIASWRSVRRTCCRPSNLRHLAWDIDFTTALRKGDTVRFLVEGLYARGEFRKYGNILAAEFATTAISPASTASRSTAGRHTTTRRPSLRKAFIKAR
jgi:hypothetical protein